MNQTEQKFPLISVITISLNTARFIEQTIQSVLSQTYPQIEYILIDGGSTDGTVDIIRKYESHLAYWHSKPDRGLAHAFNLGFEHSHGDWIIYLNAEDFFLDSSVVEKMVPHIIAHPEANLVFGETFFMTGEKNPKPAPLRKIFGRPWRWNVFRLKDTLPHQSSFTNRKYFDKVGKFDEFYRIACDYEFFLRGGQQLRPVFVPLAISGMRLGGASGRDYFQTLSESRIAQQNTNALPPILAWINLFWLLFYRHMGKIVFKVLGPFASKIKWQGRCSGKRLSNLIY
ncbi:MAG: glycosyltransferase family 2 protein [Deltaproteobacteria bacterium]|nr:glycosyltransferase family 2 protein [Deltaproteobacteria bacterium]